MNDNNKKWVQVSVIVFSALIAFLSIQAMTKMSGIFDLESKIRYLPWIMKAIAFAIGAGTFALIMLNKNTNSYLHEVMSELNKVAWPTWDETFKGTIIVVIFVVVAGAILGLFDYIWTAVLKWVV